MAAYRNLIPFVVCLILTVSFNDCNANEFVDKICPQTSDPPFCFKAFAQDMRTANVADLNGLSKLSIILMSQGIQQTLDRLPNIRRTIADPVGLRRLRVCEIDYQNSLSKVRQAGDNANKNAYWEVMNSVRDAANDIIDCHNIYRRENPITEPPTAADNLNIIKYEAIVLTINSNLVSGS